MPTVDVINLDQKKVGSIELNDAIFDVPLRKYLLSEIVHWQRSRKRSGTQCAKTKAEVHGTTKKPFPQKGRGMARQGSLKNPHQTGGGVAFAPKPRDYSYSMPKSKRRVALAVALSTRLKEDSLKVLADFQLSEAKTRIAQAALKGLGAEKALVVDCGNGTLKQCMRNLPNAKYIEEPGLNVYDILRYPVLMMTQDAVKAFEARVLAEGV